MRFALRAAVGIRGHFLSFTNEETRLRRLVINASFAFALSYLSSLHFSFSSTYQMFFAQCWAINRLEVSVSQQLFCFLSKHYLVCPNSIHFKPKPYSITFNSFIQCSHFLLIVDDSTNSITLLIFIMYQLFDSSKSKSSSITFLWQTHKNYDFVIHLQNVASCRFATHHFHRSSHRDRGWPQFSTGFD